MNWWQVLLVLAGLALIGFLLLARRRPSTAEEALGQSATRVSAPARVDASQRPLRGVIESLILNRSTGVLTVSAGNQSCSMAFLFGQLFHASCGIIQGEEALQTALRWTNPTSTFDPRAQLPVQQTITRPITSIIDAA